MESNRKGDLAEIKAIAWLWEQGYEVFRNVGCTGKIDIVAIHKDGTILKIDVKTVRWNGEGFTINKGSKKLYKEQGITLLYYYNGVISFKMLNLPEPLNN